MNPAKLCSKDTTVIAINHSRKHSTLTGYYFGDSTYTTIENKGFVFAQYLPKQKIGLGLMVNDFDFFDQRSSAFFIITNDTVNVDTGFIYNNMSSQILDISPMINKRIVINENSFLNIGAQFNFVTAKNFNRNLKGSITFRSFSLGVLYNYKTFNIGAAFKHIYHQRIDLPRPLYVAKLQKSINLNTSYSFDIHDFKFVEYFNFNSIGTSFLLGSDVIHRSGFLVGLSLYRGNLTLFGPGKIIGLPKLGFERNRYSIQLVGTKRTYNSVNSTHYDISVSVNF